MAAGWDALSWRNLLILLQQSTTLMTREITPINQSVHFFRNIAYNRDRATEKKTKLLSKKQYTYKYNATYCTVTN